MFSRASSHKYGHLSKSSHELPRWSTHSPMAASTIPPPIVESTYTLPQRPAARSAVVNKPTSTPLQDRQSELEADLQFLLDAQADGLLGGLESGLFDDRTSTGSTTPTTQSVRSASARHREKPARRKTGVRSARKGIYNSILALAAVKSEEIDEIDEDVHSRDETIGKIEGWQQKKLGLRDASENLGSNEDTVRSQRLRQEADVLQQEINHVELQLADMKSRQRKLLREVAAAENAVQAKMASYTSSLRLLEEEVLNYLSSKPSEAILRTSSGVESAAVWRLPPKRRTLDMAKQYWTDDREATQQRRERVRYEKSALDDGALMWKDVVTQVTEFERMLQHDMANWANGHSTKETAENISPSEGTQRCSAEVLDRMSGVISALEEDLKVAKERNWNLLIAAIGAEIDALRQGRQLLGGDSPPDPPDQHAVESQSDPSGGETEALEQSFATARRRASNGAAPEDEDPDPELLFSKHDLDSE